MQSHRAIGIEVGHESAESVVEVGHKGAEIIVFGWGFRLRSLHTDYLLES